MTVFASGNDAAVSSDSVDMASAHRSSVTGLVLTPAGRPVADASVLVKSLNHPAPAVPEMAVMTGSDGRYEWILPAGTWEITVFSLGGSQATKKVTVGNSRRSEVNFTLAP